MLPLAPKSDSSSPLRRRTHLLILAIPVLFLALVGRLWVLQVLQGERFTYLSENNRIRLKNIPGIRGTLFDRQGRLLAHSPPSFDILFIPEDTREPETTLVRLAELLGRDPEKLRRSVKPIHGRSPFREIVLDQDVDWRSVVAVESHQMELPGVTIRVRPSRNYPEGEMTAHLLGYLGEIGPRRLKALKSKGYRMGDEIGQSGMEKAVEEYLRGKSGGQQVEVNALGRQVQIIHQVKDVPGHNVFLTIDRDLQKITYDVLANHEGSIVVVETDTGAVLALVSKPSFDPAPLSRGITTRAWNALLRDKTHPLYNRATQGQYPPGSIFKLVLAVAALEEGVVDPKTRLPCSGSIQIGDRKFRDWKKQGHGQVDLHRGLVESCDVYFYQLALWIGIERIARYARLLGLGAKTGIPLYGERPGLIPDKQWKNRRFGQAWFPGETASVAIGQGYVSVTPLQAALLTAAIANGGTVYRPWLVRKVETVEGAVVRQYGPEKVRTIPLKHSTLQLLHRALHDVVNGPRGTGRQAHSDLITVAGKTGTAQLTEMRGETIKSKDLPYPIRDHAWFVSYAPADAPEIAVSVLVEHGGHGGFTAAPLAKKVIESYFSLKGQRLAKARDGNKPQQQGTHAN